MAALLVSLVLLLAMSGHSATSSDCVYQASPSSSTSTGGTSTGGTTTGGGTTSGGTLSGSLGPTGSGYDNNFDRVELGAVGVVVVRFGLGNDEAEGGVLVGSEGGERVVAGEIEGGVKRVVASALLGSGSGLVVDVPGPVGKSDLASQSGRRGRRGCWRGGWEKIARRSQIPAGSLEPTIVDWNDVVVCWRG
ncbi:large proline-rich protein BAG6 [Striga asiatica]|uniref:Large proline-rich protein BAG6 n=1 Tax=Striga asiatica TaxID=4170 RepID=A0A5A7Q6K6_STRAF|nr:large proline-rich protein BAG6 [Striga asiatica]